MKKVLFSTTYFFLITSWLLISLPTNINAQPVGPIGPVSPPPVNAVDFNKLFNGIPGISGIGFKFNNSKLDAVISQALVYVFVIAGLLLLLYLIYGGFQMMTSAGDPEKMKGAKEILTRAIMGFVIVFVAYWIIQVVGIAFGITDIQQTFK